MASLMRLFGFALSLKCAVALTPAAPGQTCSRDDQCASGYCKGNVCCQPTASTWGTNCAACGHGEGFCSQCEAGFAWDVVMGSCKQQAPQMGMSSLMPTYWWPTHSNWDLLYDAVGASGISPEQVTVVLAPNSGNITGDSELSPSDWQLWRSRAENLTSFGYRVLAYVNLCSEVIDFACSSAQNQGNKPFLGSNGVKAEIDKYFFEFDSNFVGYFFDDAGHQGFTTAPILEATNWVKLNLTKEVVHNAGVLSQDAVLFEAADGVVLREQSTPGPWNPFQQGLVAKKAIMLLHHVSSSSWQDYLNSARSSGYTYFYATESSWDSIPSYLPEMLAAIKDMGKPPGQMCSSDDQCGSGFCKGNVCCQSTAGTWGTNCAVCGHGDGFCSQCEVGFAWDMGSCKWQVDVAPGQTCASDDQCASGYCKGNFCCQSTASTWGTNCAVCGHGEGFCSQCEAGFAWDDVMGSCKTTPEPTPVPTQEPVTSAPPTPAPWTAPVCTPDEGVWCGKYTGECQSSPFMQKRCGTTCSAVIGCVRICPADEETWCEKYASQCQISVILQDKCKSTCAEVVGCTPTSLPQPPLPTTTAAQTTQCKDVWSVSRCHRKCIRKNLCGEKQCMKKCCNACGQNQRRLGEASPGPTSTSSADVSHFV